MVKLYLILVVLVVFLLAIPSTRRSIGRAVGLVDRDRRKQAAEQAREQAGRAAEHARTAAGAARGIAGGAAEVAKGTAGAVRDAGESVAQSLADRRLRILGRTYAVEGDPVAVGAVVAAAMDDAAVVDTVAPHGDETAAWLYSGSGDVRFAVTPTSAEPVSSLVGVVAYEVSRGEAQGVSTAADVLDRVASALTASGLRWVETTRVFTPGADDTSDGMRTRA